MNTIASSYISSGSGTKQTWLVSESIVGGLSTGYGRMASVTGGGIGGPLGPTPSPSSTLTTHTHTSTYQMAHRAAQHRQPHKTDSVTR